MKPNLILISVDQMRRDCMGISGHPIVETPNLDNMKRLGANFTKAYSAVPSCVPARTAMLTGLTQKTHGRVGYKDSVNWNYKTTIASELTKAGYQTECVGKMHVHPQRSLCGFHNIRLHDGFMHYSRKYDKPSNESFESVDDYSKWLRDEIGADLNDSGIGCNSWVARPFPYEEKYHPTNWVVSESIDFLRKRDPRMPFFLHMSFVRPHSPLDPPEYYFNMYNNMDIPDPCVGDWADSSDSQNNGLDPSTQYGIIPKRALKRARAAYYGHITHIDHQLGRFFEVMGEHKLQNNTVYIFTSDHGDLLGDHNLFRKVLPYEGSSGVPFIVYDPGRVLGFKQNATINSLVELRDIFPSLLDFAGVEIPDYIEGKSVLPILKKKSSDNYEYVHGEHEYGKKSNHFIVTKTDKYIWYSSTGKEQYFDLENDRNECFDLINSAKHSERISYLRSRLIFELDGREEGYSDGKSLIAGKEAKKVLSFLND